MPDQSDFVRLLDRLIRERFRSAARFAEAADVDPTAVTRILNGERGTPKKVLAAWAKVLGLSKTEAEDFIVEGELDDAPTARKRVRTLAARVAEQARELDVLAIKVDALTSGRSASR